LLFVKSKGNGLKKNLEVAILNPLLRAPAFESPAIQVDEGRRTYNPKVPDFSKSRKPSEL